MRPPEHRYTRPSLPVVPFLAVLSAAVTVFLALMLLLQRSWIS